MTTFPTRFLGLISLPIVLSAVLAAQQAAPPSAPQAPQQTPPPVAFSTRVDLVLVDVNAVDANNRPIEGLKPGEFTVNVDGKPRKVVAANYVPYPKPANGGKAEAAPRPDEWQPVEEFSSNQMQKMGPERLVMIVVDENNIRAGAAQPVMRAAARFVDSLLPTDRVGLISFPAGARVEVTNNHRAVKDGLAKIVGHRRARSSSPYVTLSEAFDIAGGNSQVYDDVYNRECVLAAGRMNLGSESLLQSCRQQIRSESLQISNETIDNARTTLQVLRKLTRSLREIQGPKTLLLISETLPLDEKGQLLGDIMDAASDAAAGRVTMYGIRIDPPPIDVASVASLGSTSVLTNNERSFLFSGFETLVSASRGTLFSVTGQGDNVFSRIAWEMSGYYLLGFEPEPGDRDGKSHSIQVKLARPGAQIRARREFTVTNAGYRGGESDQTVLTRTLQAPYLADEFPLSLSAYAVRDANGSKVRILVGADVDADAASPTDYALGVTVRDRRGTVVNTFLQRLKLQPRGRLAPLAYSASVPVEPGDYVVKLVARDPMGRLASVEHPVSARFAAVGPFDSGALIIADEEKAPSSKCHPSVDGTIRGPKTAAYVELHAGDKQVFEGASVMIEAAETAQGPALLSAPVSLEPEADDKRVAFGRLDVGLLPPGRYVLRAVVSAGGREAGRLSRAFVVPPSSSLFASRGVASKAKIAPFAAIGKTFDVQRVLTPDVVGPFLDRLTSGGRSLSAPAKSGLDLARAGKFDTIAEKLPPAQGSLEVSFLRGLSLLARRDLEKGAVEFRAALRAQNDFFPAAFYLATCYAAGGKDKDALAGFATAIAGEGDLRIAYVEAVEAAVRLDNWDRAASLAKDASAQWPDDPAVAKMAIAGDAMTGHEVEAYQAVSRYLQAHTDDQEALFLALRLVALGQDKAGRGPGTVDRDAFTKYQKRYAATKGPNQALVDLWGKQLAR
jgi:VWFA-related protein